MVRVPCCDKNGLRKGSWAQEEDRKLVAYITKYGHWNWGLLPKFAGLARCGKSCRLRWMNYLKPGVKRGNFRKEDDETIIRLHEKLGNRWSMIAAELPCRTDNEIKNYWHTTLKKRFEQKSDTNSETKKTKDFKLKNQSPVLEAKEPERAIDNNNWPFSPQPWYCEFTSSITNTNQGAINQENLVIEDDLILLEPYTEPMCANFWTEPYLTDVSYVAPNTELSEYFSLMYNVELWGQQNNFN